MPGKVAVPQVAVINQSSADDTDVAFACAAVDMQLREDFCPAWPEVQYQPVTFFRSTKNLPVASGISIIFSIVDNFDGLEAQAAYHSWAGVPFVKIGYGLGDLGVLLSHEAMEEIVNPTCLRMFVTPDGKSAAHEVCDPVQAWTYTKRPAILWEERDVNVSAFCLPPYFTGGDLPCAYAPGFAVETLLPGRIAPGGYLPILGPNGWEPRYGANADMAMIAKKAQNHTGRAARRK